MDVEGADEDLTEPERKLLSTLVHDAKAAYEGYLEWVASLSKAAGLRGGVGRHRDLVDQFLSGVGSPPGIGTQFDAWFLFGLPVFIGGSLFSRPGDEGFIVNHIDTLTFADSVGCSSISRYTETISRTYVTVLKFICPYPRCEITIKR